MSQSLFPSVSEQVADLLREGLLRGRWRGVMPGRDLLAGEFGVSGNTMEAALRQLQDEGFLVSQGAGRRRKIVLPEGGAPPSLRVELLLFEKDDRRVDYILDLQHQLTDAGHVAAFASKTLCGLGMDVRRVARMVEHSPVDAWVVVGGSQEVLTWFAEHPVPVFALAGRRRGLPIASCGPDKPHSFSDATRRLIELGHRRIVLLARPARRRPEPGASERAFLAELEAHGLSTGSYNMPDWEESIEGFHACLELVFRSTPPTALIIDQASFYFATQQYLLNRGIRVPQDISVVCTDGDPHFAWCKPSVAHIVWDSRPMVRRIVRWAANVSHGKDDRRESSSKAEFVDGGTIGPVKGRG